MPNADSGDLRKRKRRPKPGDIQALRRILWQALTEVERLLEHDTPELKLKSASTLGVLGGCYLKALQASDLEQRLAALEERLALQEAT